MSYFIRAQDLIINTALEFGTITMSSLQQFSCVRGEVAGFQIQQLGNGPNGAPLYISQIYNCTTGTPILIGSAAVLPGIDLTGGYFSSGCFPTADPLANGTIFIKANYVS